MQLRIHGFQRDVAHRQCFGRLEEEAAVSEFSQHHGMLGQMQPQRLPHLWGKGHRSAL